MELKFVDIDDYRKQVKHLFVTAFPCLLYTSDAADEL
mgnify:CR=1 FL=1